MARRGRELAGIYWRRLASFVIPDPSVGAWSARTCALLALLYSPLWSMNSPPLVTPGRDVGALTNVRHRDVTSVT